MRSYNHRIKPMQQKIPERSTLCSSEAPIVFSPLSDSCIPSLSWFLC